MKDLIICVQDTLQVCGVGEPDPQNGGRGGFRESQFTNGPIRKYSIGFPFPISSHIDQYVISYLLAHSWHNPESLRTDWRTDRISMAIAALDAARYATRINRQYFVLISQ